MKSITKILGAAMFSFAVASVAHGHGDEHAKKNIIIKKEQKEWGIAGDAKAVKRTITLSMTDNMRFTPALIEVKQGDTVKLVMKNDGKQMHEMVLGTKKELEEQIKQH